MATGIKFDYFDYDRLISIDFGSTWTKFAYYDIRNEQLVLDHGNACSNQPSACLYSVINGDYDHATLIQWGNEAEYAKYMTPDSVYVDKLLDKVEYLFQNQPDVNGPLHKQLDRFYMRAILDHLKRVDNFIIAFINSKDSNCDASKNRYVMTYPSGWSSVQIAYLRALAIRAGIVSEQDHPRRLIMYGEAEAILRYVQESGCSPTIKLRQGHKYMICDLGGSKVKMHLYSITEPQDSFNSMLGESRCKWNVENADNPVLEFGSQNILEGLETYALNELFPGSNFTVKDLEDRLVDRRKDFGKFIEGLFDSVIKEFTDENIENSVSHYINIPFRLTSSAGKKPLSGKKGKLEIKQTDILNHVFKPVTDKIIDYIENILHNIITVKVEAIILVGGFRHSQYLLKLISEACERKGKPLLVPFNDRGYEFKSFEIVCGAIYKSMDTSEAQDPVPKIKFDDEKLDLLSKHSTDVLVIIDLGFERTRCSFVEIKEGRNAIDIYNNNIKHITQWPGQELIHDYDFPTFDTILISGNKKNKGIIASKKCNSLVVDIEQKYFGKSGSIKRYYTFERDERGIILLTHQKSPVEEVIHNISDHTYREIEDLQVAQPKVSEHVSPHSPDDIEMFLYYRKEESAISKHKFPSTSQQNKRYLKSYKYTATRQRITTKEFTFIYLGYLHNFLCDCIYKETGYNLKSRYRYCLSRDNNEFPQDFSLSDRDLRQIMRECKIIQDDLHPYKLLLLHRAEASAIYCRTFVDKKTLENRQNQSHFLQVYMYRKRCVLLLNHIPATENKDTPSAVIERQAEDVKERKAAHWEGIYKYSQSEIVPIDIMDEICNNLWSHLQTYHHLIKKCSFHKRQRKFFDLQNRQVFKSQLQDYITKTFLDIDDSEKIHTIYICDCHSHCCYIAISNMDLLEFAIEPTLNHFVSIIRASTLNQDLFRGIQLSNIFLLGEFILCRDRRSYKVLEDILLFKLQKINFRRLDNLILQRMTKNTQVSKITIPKEEEEMGDSIAYASLRGSVLFGLDPRNRLLERYACRTYAVHIRLLDISSEEHNSSSNSTLEKETQVMFQNTNAKRIIENDELIPIINKGERVSASSKNEIGRYFYLTNNTYQKIEIALYASVEDKIENFTISNSNFDHIHTFVIQGYHDFTYPIVLKSIVSQTKSFKFWVTYGKIQEKGAVNIRENLQLKSYFDYEGLE